MTEPLVEDAQLARAATGLLRTFNTAGVLSPADVHTARLIGRVCGETDERVLLAAALTVRALRLGSVCLDLATVALTVFDAEEQEVAVDALPWPEAGGWLEAVRASPATALGADAPDDRPLRFAFDRLYLQRYWRQEETVRTELLDRTTAPPPAVGSERLADALARLFPGHDLPPGEPDRQRLAAAVSALRWVTVLAGGPGTGKTTTVARLLALLDHQRGPDRAPLRVALAAPTGKAAARLEQAVREASAAIAADGFPPPPELRASTVHRLLGWRPESRSRFRHDRHQRLPYDVVVVDEMSMVSLTLMARLLEAVRPDARLVLVGDPDQLSSVEAGAVLSDVATAPGVAEPVLQQRLDGLGVADREPVVNGVVALRHTWRFGGAIDALARAIRGSDADEVIRVLRSGDPALRFVETGGGETDGLTGIDPAALASLRSEVVRTGRAVVEAAVAGDARGALAAMDAHRLLCGHRRGPYGASRWSRESERWLAEAIEGYGLGTSGLGPEWYLGRPLLITANDHDQNLYNGDTGVVVETPAGMRAAFLSGPEPTLISPVRLDHVQTVHAMTVHKAQGSQFGVVSFVVPPPDSPLLTRELVYTAVTRASTRVQVFGSEEAIRRAVLRPANRASGLRDRLSAAGAPATP